LCILDILLKREQNRWKTGCVSRLEEDCAHSMQSDRQRCCHWTDERTTVVPGLTE